MEKYTNDLINESSPYLLQHAHNPVNWVSWSNDAFEKAKLENKLVLVSIGYSACHWCHVMEHESFENEEVAALMNRFFICIKVDREERPDVDQIYMSAVQLMTQQGGWPLNCFTLPDGRPVYGGTYFQKEQWMQILRSLNHTFEHKYEEVISYASRLHEGIQQSELIDKPLPIAEFQASKINELILRWSANFDQREGGGTRAPKFPLPSNYDFLLRYATWNKDSKVKKHVFLTLTKMAQGGIYDQIGGGFARYSVDMLWKVPHFEKMLYDNGQLISLYAKAYQEFKDPSFKRVVYQTVEWLERDMLTPEGAFFSAVDADSEGEEGKFYVWTKEELQSVLDKDFDWVKNWYSVNGKGYWENGNYILLRNDSDKDFANQHDWSLEELYENVDRINEILRNERSHRIHPGIDDKSLTSWNAITLKGLVDAYFALNDSYFLHLALKNARWIVKYQTQTNNRLFHNYKAGKSNIDGFLEDYAHAIAAFIRLYEATFDEQWLQQANEWTAICIAQFQDADSKMFYFTSSDSELIARKMELNDNVIPSSNSVMATNLFQLGKLLHSDTYIDLAKQMLSNVYDGMEYYGSGYSNWGISLLNFIQPLAEICITGPDSTEQKRSLMEHYLPNSIVFGGTNSSLKSAERKTSSTENQIYICQQNTCFPPVKTWEEALKLIQSMNN
jgi:uncharacterized protein YyaL (SSP411 family)